ncbi:enterobactin transporter EntS [Methylosinus sp. Sm6]|uniref:enterobactin transporter EntS n=1 Tax=Methylosinus sp. Sm6 TaxID=2866948 RepID=UPI001C9917F1|nr:enterobactin transporter EntS [Methylosinus sp. Sm6]MBY6240091.1 enterobactin transporter EntS [Methylosinus sp. Sm6]
MTRPRILTDFSLLRNNRDFRAVFVARTLSLLALGLLTVAVPVQALQLTGSPAAAGFIVAFGGAAAFVGLLAGGVLADRHDRRQLILFARGTCGLGFVALALNGFSTSPSLAVVYALAAWDGFFSALGITALLAATPAIVGRENLAAAGALNMIAMRLGGVASPALGGLLIMSAGLGWTYACAAAGVLATLAPLMRLPSLPPKGASPETPARALLAGVRYLFENRVVGAVVAVGTLASLAGGVRILFPALAGAYGGGPAEAGLMYSAVPLGAALGATTSGFVARIARPGLALLSCAAAAFVALAALDAVGGPVPALLLLVVYGYLGSIVSLLQFTLVQKNTPDRLLGRVNGLWTAQFIVGDALGALLLGLLGGVLSPAPAVGMFGLAALLSCLTMAAAFGALRRSPAEPSAEVEATEKEKQSFAPSR